MSSKSKSFDPGSRIGVFGGGQLGRMFAHAAQRLGFHVVIFSPEQQPPATQVVHQSFVADYDDLDAVRRFAQSVDVITLEFENISLDAVQEASRWTEVRPNAEILSIAQHRIREKSTLKRLGFPVTPFSSLEGRTLESIGTELGWPLILKTAMMGYDGKGQRKVATAKEATQAMLELQSEMLIAEKVIEFLGEVSLLVARNSRGDIEVFPMFFNEHSNHILDLTLCPVPAPYVALQKQGEAIARGLAESIQLEGLLCIEFFIDPSGELLINELAPRPHNSGHLTIEASSTSQFEQQVRAVCNQPLGKTDLRSPAAVMANLLGDLWDKGRPNCTPCFQERDVYLHLYGKDRAMHGRKMGHLTVLDESLSGAEQKAKRLREAFGNRDGTAIAPLR